MMNFLPGGDSIMNSIILSLYKRWEEDHERKLRYLRILFL